MSELKEIPVELLDDHPDNPRLIYREDVIDGIAANLHGEYPQKHAIHVRPVGGRYQTLAGHHRRRAAQKAGLATVWAWVEELDDEAAFMELALSNNQGELSPLEIGLHALRAVPLGTRGRGNKGGGMKEYAAQIGKQPSRVTEYRQAAEVITTVGENIPSMESFLDKAQHLAAIHRLPEGCWGRAVSNIGTDSSERVRERVAQAVQFKEDFDPGEWSQFLPIDDCTAAVFCGTDPGNFRRLSALAGQVHQWLLDHECKDLAKQWKTWLLENAGCESWEQKEVQKKRLELEQIAWDREEAKKPKTQEALPVQVLLADPPWQYDFAETDSRQIENQYPTATPEEIATHLNSPLVFPRKLADDCVLFMWATAPKLQEALQVMKAWGFTYKTQAVWDKERVGMGYWFRGQHEIILVGTRGKMSPPEPENRFPSVFREKRDNKHSAKPDCVYEAIEAMFPNAERFEIYQRRARHGWDGGGNEAGGEL